MQGFVQTAVEKVQRGSRLPVIYWRHRAFFWAAGRLDPHPRLLNVVLRQKKERNLDGSQAMLPRQEDAAHRIRQHDCVWFAAPGAWEVRLTLRMAEILVERKKNTNHGGRGHGMLDIPPLIVPGGRGREGVAKETITLAANSPGAVYMSSRGGRGESSQSWEGLRDRFSGMDRGDRARVQRKLEKNFFRAQMAPTTFIRKPPRPTGQVFLTSKGQRGLLGGGAEAGSTNTAKKITDEIVSIEGGGGHSL